MKSKRKVQIGLLVTALVVVGMVGYAWRSVLSTANRYDEELAAAKREGAIITPDDLRKRYGGPDVGNSGPIIQAIPQNLKLVAKGSEGPPSPEQVAEAKAIVAHLGDLDTYLATTHCDLRKEWESGWEVAFSEFSPAKTLTKALAVVAQDAVRRGDLRAAEKELTVGRRLGRDLGQTPSLIAILVQIAQEAIVANTCSQIAVQNRGNKPVMAMLRRVLAEKRVIDYRRAMEGEMMFQYQFSQGDMDLRGTGNDSAAAERAARIPGMRTAWRTNILRWIRFTKQQLDAHPDDPMGLAKSLDYEKWRGEKQGAEKLTYLASDILAPVLNQAFTVTLKPEVDRQMALTWVDLCETTGPWPTRPPVAHKDPYTGAELQLVRDGDSLAVICVGPNGKLENKTRKGSRGDDFGWWLTVPGN